MIIALAGGVGGARLADGLAAALPPGALLVVVNTGDDFTHLGLSISPDIDTVVYTLSGLADTERGWGVAGESWEMLAALARLGGETWFRLGDRDLATHLERSRRLAAGQTLSEITADFAARLGIVPSIIPMTDDPVHTVVDTDEGALAFQDYFVRRQCAPKVRALRFDGAVQARPAPAVMEALASPALEAVIICPSNPFLSLGPLLAMPAFRDALAATTAPVVAVSPIIGGKAVKGPAAKIMAELVLVPGAAAVARYYGSLLHGFVLDQGDAAEIKEVPVPCLATDILMRTTEDRVRLAREVVSFTRTLR
jgi:LPPG:FO 2-phospho-L-lactate transferase